MPDLSERIAQGEPTGLRLTWLDVVEIVAKRIRLILVSTLLGSVLAAVASLMMAPVYTATATIAPPQAGSSLSQLALSNLGQGLPFIGALGAGRSGPDLYAGMLKSRTIADNIIQRFGLASHYVQTSMVDVRKALAANTRVTVSKEGIIFIDVDDDDPKRAADIANAYVEELDKLTREVAVTDAARRRLFFERQLKEAKNQLAQAEIDLKSTQEKTGLIALSEQGRVLIESIANLRAQVAAKEMQLASMSSYATADNPDVLRLKIELSSLRTELSRLEETERTKDQGTLVSAARVPAAGLEYVRRLREVKYQETLFELIARQFELAKAEEARESGPIQALDKAVPPDKRSRPRRTLIVVMTAILFGILATSVVVIAEVWRRYVAMPMHAEQVGRIRRLLRLW